MLPPFLPPNLDIAHVLQPLLPAVPFMPFFPVVVADFLPRETPASYKRNINNDNNKPFIVCAGDSLTHGSISSHWVDRLGNLLGEDDHYTVLNAGINSETVAALRARIDDIVSVQPRFLTILIGTNDLIGSLDRSAGLMYQIKLPAQKQAPSLDSFAQELQELVQELDQSLAPVNTQIAVLSPPPLGEGIDGLAWTRGKEMAQICRRVCDQTSSERVVYLPLFEQVRDEMRSVISDEGQEFDFGAAIPLTSVVVPWHLLVQRTSLAGARKANGYDYTIDGVHFCDEFGDIVLNLIGNWVDRF